MVRQLLRLTFSMLLMALLWAATVSVYAEDGPKQKAHGAYSTSNELLWPGVIDQTFFHFNFQGPEKGYFDYFDFSGPWAGSWAETEVQELFFGTYNGSVAEVVGRPVVYYWSKMLAGEEIFNGDYPGVLDPNYQPPYQNIEGWFRVGGMVDGGPGHEDDVGFPSFPIPPEGLQWLCAMSGLCNGEQQAQGLYYMLVYGMVDFGGVGIVTGNIRIKTDRRDQGDEGAD